MEECVGQALTRRLLSLRHVGSRGYGINRDSELARECARVMSGRKARKERKKNKTDSGFSGW